MPSGEEKELVVVLAYIRKLSLALKTRSQNSINKTLPFFKIKVIFKSSTYLPNFFRFKDKAPLNWRSNAVYKSSCGRSSATYDSKICRHLNVGVGEHSGVSPVAREKSKTKTTTAVKDHVIFCNIAVSFKDFKTLANINSEFHLKIKECLLISHDKPVLNRSKKDFTTLLIWLMLSHSIIFWV